MPRPRLLVGVTLLVLAAGVSANAELAVLANGTTFKLTSHHVDGEQVWLVLKSGGELALPPSALVGFVPDEVLEAVAPARDLGEFERLAVDAARRHGLEPALVLAVAAVESGFEPGAVSPKGAQGLMQLMPATARELGVVDALDPEQNLDGGVRYLRRLLERYGGDLRKALAAYNAGAGAVDRHAGVPPYRETRDYVRRVLGRYGEDR